MHIWNKQICTHVDRSFHPTSTNSYKPIKTVFSLANLHKPDAFFRDIQIHGQGHEPWLRWSDQSIKCLLDLYCTSLLQCKQKCTQLILFLPYCGEGVFSIRTIPDKVCKMCWGSVTKLTLRKFLIGQLDMQCKKNLNEVVREFTGWKRSNLQPRKPSSI